MTASLKYYGKQTPGLHEKKTEKTQNIQWKVYKHAQILRETLLVTTHKTLYSLFLEIKTLHDKQVPFGTIPHCMKPQKINTSCERKIKTNVRNVVHFIMCC